MALNTNSIKTARQSNMELLRIIAMIMVLIVHVNFDSLGAPDKTVLELNSFARVFFEGASKGCVNLFVMISGWFLIKPSLKGFCKLVFQVLFFVVLGTVLMSLLTGDWNIDLFGILKRWFSYYWFVISYVGLYLLSPILNAFLKQASKKTILQFLCAFYAFQTIYGWMLDMEFINAGFSTFSFIGLYVLAYYLRTTQNKIYSKGLIVYAISVFLNIVIYFLPVENSLKLFDNYTNPLVIIGCCGMMMWFSTLKIASNKVINYLAGSALAIYLFHTHYLIYFSCFRYYTKLLYTKLDGFVYLGAIAIVIIGIYLLSVMFDRCRILIWDTIVRVNFRNIGTNTNILKLINR